MSSASVSLLAEKVSSLKVRYGHLDEIGCGPRSAAAPMTQQPQSGSAHGGGSSSFQQQLQQASALPRGPDIRIDSSAPPMEVLTTNKESISRPVVPPREVVLIRSPPRDTVMQHQQQLYPSSSSTGGVSHLYAPQSSAEVAALERQQHLQSPNRVAASPRGGSPPQQQHVDVPVVTDDQQRKVTGPRPAQDKEILRKLIADEAMRQQGFVVSTAREAQQQHQQQQHNTNMPYSVHQPAVVPRAQPMSAATLQHHAAAASPIERPREYAQLGQPTPHHTADSLFYSPPGKATKQNPQHQQGTAAVAGNTTAADILVVDGAQGQEGVANGDHEVGVTGETNDDPLGAGVGVVQGREGAGTVVNQLYRPQPVPHSVTTHHQHHDPAVGAAASSGIAGGARPGSATAIRAAERAEARRAHSREGAVHHGRPASKTGRLGKPQPYHRRPKPVVGPNEDFHAAQEKSALDRLLTNPTARIGPEEQAALLQEAHQAYGSIARIKTTKSSLYKQVPNIVARPRTDTQFPQPPTVNGVMARLSDHALALNESVKQREQSAQRRQALENKGLVDDADEVRNNKHNSQAHHLRLSSGKHGTRRTREGSIPPKKRGHSATQIYAWDRGVKQPQ